ncbi:MAG: hypothetical protein V4618_07740 [Pseudomonadota bacterium]
MLSACHVSPEITACESFIRKKIATPSTLKVVSSSSVAGSAKGIFGLKPTDRVMLVSIEYDAANEYGAPVRTSAFCAFPMKDGKLPSLQEMEGDASSSAFSAKLHANGPLYTDLDSARLIEQADAIDRGERIYDCCIPEQPD